MREGIIRVLENNIDPSILKDTSIIDNDMNSDSEDESQPLMDAAILWSRTNGFNNANNLAQEDGKYTISDISNALGMNKEEKTMSRVLTELKKVHSSQI